LASGEALLFVGLDSMTDAAAVAEDTTVERAVVFRVRVGERGEVVLRVRVVRCHEENGSAVGRAGLVREGELKPDADRRERVVRLVE
jgi:hypothetical protein